MQWIRLKFLCANQDLILLDKPNKPLGYGINSMVRGFLEKCKTKAVMVISHDRTFVDNITNRTIEVTMGRIYDYKAKYSDYLVLRQDRRIHQQKAYDRATKIHC